MTDIVKASPAKPAKIWIDPSECESHILAAVLTFLYTLDYSANGVQTLRFGLPQDESANQDPDKVNQHSIATLGLEADTSTFGDNSVDSTTAASIMTPEYSSDVISTKHNNPDPSEAANELVFHAKVCMAGQRFGIISLYEVAKHKFDMRLRSGPWHREMVPCIREVYRQGDVPMGSLKEDMVRFAQSRFRDLKACGGFDELVLDFPGFAADLLKGM